MAKKILLLTAVVLFLCPQSRAQDIDPYGWALIGADLAFTGAAIAAGIDAASAAGEYDKLHALIDDTTYANYYRLLYEKEKADNRITTAACLGITAGISLAYTALDYFWLHRAFPDIQAAVSYDCSNNCYMLAVSGSF